VLTHALALAARGFRVHPLHDVVSGQCSCGKPDCIPKHWGKHPRVFAWQKHATTDTVAITAWWHKWPAANVGVACGGGLYVIDVDPGNGGSLEPFGELPPTLTVRTATGGTHLYYSVADDLPNSASKLAQGVDTRGKGGYVVGACSVRLQGTYEVIHDLPIAPLPDCLRPPAPARHQPRAGQLVLAGGTDVLQRARRYLDRVPGAIQGQDGSSDALRAAIKVGCGFSLPEDDCLELLMGDWNSRCVPPWSEAELRHKVTDAYRVTAAHGWLLTKPQQSQTSQERPAASAAAAGTRKRIHGITDGELDNIKVLLRDHRPLLLGSDAPIRLNMLTGQVEHGSTLTNIDAMATRICEAAGEKLCVETQKLAPDGSNLMKKLVLDASKVERSLRSLILTNRYNPVEQWLRSLPPVATGAIERVGRDALGLTLPIHLTVWRMWLISAVARAFEPGAQADSALVLVCAAGGQRKSSVFRALAPDWFTDTYMDVVGYGRTNAYQLMQRYWLVELGELERVPNKLDRARVKGFITTRSDDFRPPYGEAITSNPRHSVLCATSNSNDFLSSTDTAYNRRFWPIAVGNLDANAVSLAREELWAEAVGAYQGGEAWHFERDDPRQDLLTALHEDHAADETDTWEPTIVSWLATWTKTVTLADLLMYAVKIPPSDQTTAHSMRAAQVLRTLGYRSGKQLEIGGVRIRPWSLALSSPLHPPHSNL